MIYFDGVSFKYENNELGVKDISLEVAAGEVVCLCGVSGSGKTTATRLMNGLAPHFFEGLLQGEIRINEQSSKELTVYEIAKYVGSVFQNPRSQFFSLNTTNELAFGLENQAADPAIIKKRIIQVAEELHIYHLLGRSILKLSGGEKQMIACAAISVLDPSVIVLDEPSSNLDVRAISRLKEIIAIWKSKGKTIIIAEHRLAYLLDSVDRFLYFSNGHLQNTFLTKDLLALDQQTLSQLGLRSPVITMPCFMEKLAEGFEQLVLHDFYFSYKGTEKAALQIDQMILPKNEITAVIGHNGAGKSTLARCLCGLEKNFHGGMTTEQGEFTGKQLRSTIYMVFQDVNCQLFAESVAEEILLNKPNMKPEELTLILESVGLEGLEERHPLSLSGGQKQRLAIAGAIASDRQIFIFDEPTSGLDGKHMKQVAANLELLKSLGKTILLISHDYELITLCATEVIEIEAGKLVNQYPLTSENANKLVSFFNN